MKLYLDTSGPITTLKLDELSYTLESEHQLARELLNFIHSRLQEQGRDWADISSIHYFSGPGSFTGLRIGAAIVNALADQLQVPLYDQNGTAHQIIIPFYGRPANVTSPKS